MKKLYELSQEYMLIRIEQIIRQELIKQSKSLMLTKDMGYAGPLFILADEIRCEEAFDNCLHFISQNLNIHEDFHFKTVFLTEGAKTDTWTLLMKNKRLRENSKTN